MHLEPGNISVSMKVGDLLDTRVTYTIAKKRGTPTSDHAAQTLGYTNLAVRLHVALIELRINLTATFDQVQGRNSRVGKTLWIARSGNPFQSHRNVFLSDH